jgi:ComF family protein
MAVNDASMTKVYNRLIIGQASPCCLCGQTAPAESGLCHQCEADLPTLSQLLYKSPSKPLPKPLSNSPAKPLDKPQSYSTLCRCALPLRDHSAGTDGEELAPLCGRCLDQPPPFIGVQAPLLYCHPVARLINQWKHRGRMHLQRPLQHLLLSQLPSLPEVDMVVPIPLHWRRQWWRGFNQAALLAQALAEQHQLPLKHALRRRHSRRQQQGSNAQQRRQALLHSFIARQPLDGAKVLLVDDVITTGSTVRSASTALLIAGAASVSVAALCRVLPPENNQTTEC